MPEVMAKSRSRGGRVRLSAVMDTHCSWWERAMSREPWHITGRGRQAVWDSLWCIILTRTLAWARERKDGVMHCSHYVYRLYHFALDMCWYSNVVEYIWLLIMFPCCFDHHWYGMYNGLNIKFYDHSIRYVFVHSISCKSRFVFCWWLELFY